MRAPLWKLGAGVALLGYAAFQVFVFVKFTPLFTALDCGDQAADLQDFSLGVDFISLQAEMAMRCGNRNPYAVKIGSSTPGHVFAGADRALDMGTVGLVEGSTLPDNGFGEMRVAITARLPAARGEWPNHFLKDAFVPLFMELHFNMDISLSFGLGSFSVSAPFSKKCGLHVGGLLVDLGRLGPVVCRDSFDAVAVALESAKASDSDAMVFSAAQMDPERIRMGEDAKNLGTIGTGLAAVICALRFLHSWATQTVRSLRVPEMPPPQESYFQKLLQGLGGQSSEPQGDKTTGFIHAGVLGWLGLSSYAAMEAAPRDLERKSHSEEASRSSGPWQFMVTAAPEVMSRNSTSSTEASDSDRFAGQPMRGSASLGAVLTLLSCSSRTGSKATRLVESSPTSASPSAWLSPRWGTAASPTTSQRGSPSAWSSPRWGL